MIKYLAVIALMLLVQGCGSTGGRTLFDRLEFEEGECGTFKITGTVDTNKNPFVSSNVYAELNKTKPCPD